MTEKTLKKRLLANASITYDAIQSLTLEMLDCGDKPPELLGEAQMILLKLIEDLK